MRVWGLGLGLGFSTRVGGLGSGFGMLVHGRGFGVWVVSNRFEGLGIRCLVVGLINVLVRTARISVS